MNSRNSKNNRNNNNNKSNLKNIKFSKDRKKLVEEKKGKTNSFEKESSKNKNLKQASPKKDSVKTNNFKREKFKEEGLKREVFQKETFKNEHIRKDEMRKDKFKQKDNKQVNPVQKDIKKREVRKEVVKKDIVSKENIKKIKKEESKLKTDKLQSVDSISNSKKPTNMRINKYLSSQGITSRRNIDELIKSRKITVNGVLATPGMLVSPFDDIYISGKKITENNNKKIYYLLHKPTKVISSTKDPRGRKTVVDLIKTDKRIFPIGRLDYMTSGLLLLTNDGEIFNRLIHPRSELFKKYFIRISGSLSKSDIHSLSSGIESKELSTLPAILENIKYTENFTELYISIREGKNRQIRKMFEFLDYTVLKLRRDSIGKIELGKLKVGEYRELEPKEIDYLFSL